MIALSPGGNVTIQTKFGIVHCTEETILRDAAVVARLLAADNQVKLFDDPVANNLAHKLLKKIITGQQ